MIGIYLLIAIIAVAIYVQVKGDKKVAGWKIVDPTKKGGSFSLYFLNKHIANIRGKTKAMVVLAAMQGKDMTKELDMKKPVAVKPVAKKVVAKKVAKKVVAKKVTTKVVAKKAVAKKVAK